MLFGPSPAGSAYVPALCDMVIMVDKQATAYLGSPRMAEMVIGENVSEEELGGARMHCTVSGLGDILVENDEEAIERDPRYWLSFLPRYLEKPPRHGTGQRATAGPHAAGPRPAAPRQPELPFDVKLLIDALVDDGSVIPRSRPCSPRRWSPR